MNKKVVAVVVTYNRKELLKEAIIALMNQRYRDLQVLVIDNNSSDGTKEFISDLVDNIKVFYMNTGKNLGGSGGFNYGIKEAMKMDSDYIWIMDDDCIVKENALMELLKFAQSVNDDFGYLSSYVEWKDGTPCKMNVQRSGLKSSITDFGANGQEIQLASFVSLFIRPQVVEEVGLPIKDFFIWGDDWEYTYRISKKYKCYYVADSVVTHKSTMNIGSDISRDDYEKLSRYFYAYRNERYFYRQAGFKGKVYHILKILLHIKRILFSKIDHKWKRLSTMFKGLKAGKKFNPEIEYVYGVNSKIKVLEFFGEPLSYGGQEAFMLNMYRNFEDSRIQYTFATPFKCDNMNLIELAKQRNDEIVYFDFEFDSNQRKKYILECAKTILRNNKYDVIHIQSGSIFTLLNVAKIAKKAGVKKVIVHSHCTGENNLKYKLIKTYSDLFIRKYVDVFMACSDFAAIWKFPKKIIKSKHYYVANNGIDIQKFTYNSSTREEYRKNFKINDEIVLCNIGRFSLQKNHSFIVEIAKGLKDINFNFKFILVGDGELKEKTINKIKEYDLEDKFILLEKRDDVAKIMMASDIFIMPSLYEGFPVTLIESQATGLVSFSSDTITKEAEITNLISYLPISDVKVWIDKIVGTKKLNENRNQYAEAVASNGYNAKQNAKALEEIYINNYKKEE